MRVKMKDDAPGSPDGVIVNQYAAGDVYEVTEDLGNAFLAEGLAEETKAKPTAEPGEDKQDAGPDEDK